MQTVQLNSLHVPKGKTSTPVSSHLYQHCFHKRCNHIHSRTCCSGRLPALLSSPPESLDRGACGDEVEYREEDKTYLPPLVKLQGPFKEPEKVWRQRVKPLEPTLRTATPYNSVKITRSANHLYIGISDFLKELYPLILFLLVFPSLLSSSYGCSHAQTCNVSIQLFAHTLVTCAVLHGTKDYLGVDSVASLVMRKGIATYSSTCNKSTMARPVYL